MKNRDSSKRSSFWSLFVGAGVTLTDIGLYGGMAALTALFIYVTVEVEFGGNILLGLVAFLLAGFLAWLGGKIRTRVGRLAILLCSALVFGVAYVWLRQSSHLIPTLL